MGGPELSAEELPGCPQCPEQKVTLVIEAEMLYMPGPRMPPCAEDWAGETGAGILSMPGPWQRRSFAESLTRWVHPLLVAGGIVALILVDQQVQLWV